MAIPGSSLDRWPGSEPPNAHVARAAWRIPNAECAFAKSRRVAQRRRAGWHFGNQCGSWGRIGESPRRVASWEFIQIHACGYQNAGVARYAGNRGGAESRSAKTGRLC